mgnify:CR=1 FL=1
MPNSQQENRVRELTRALKRVVAQFAKIDDSKWPTRGMRLAIENAKRVVEDA